MVTHPDQDNGRSGPEGTETGPATQPIPRPDGATHGATDEDPREVARLREELAAANSRLDTRARRHHRVTVFRQILAALLVVVAAVGCTLSVDGVWAARTTLDTDRWVETVAPLDESPAVRAAVSTYMTDQIFETLDVQQRLQEALPPRAGFLAAPLAGQVRGYIKTSVNTVLASDQFAQVWPEINRVAHKQIMAVINDESAVVQSSGQTVTLNLLPVVNQVLTSLEQKAPTLFGKTLNLPTITDGQIPAGLETKIESALGVTLPANFAAIPIYRGDELTAVQQTVVQAKQYVALLVAGSVLALVLALVISPRRRRTTLQFGVWLAVAVVALTSLIRAVRTQLIEQVPGGVMREGADAAVQVVFAGLRERGTQLIWLGVLIALVAYLVGPGRGPVALRHWVVQAAHFVSGRARRYTAVVVAEGPGFARAHLDPLRIGGAVVAGVLLLVFSSWTGLLVIAVALGLYEVLVTAVASVEHPPTSDRAGASARDSGARGGTVSTA